MPAGCLSSSCATRTESLLQTEAVLTCPTKGGGSITRVQAKHVPMCYRIPLCACFSCLSAASCRCNGSHAISLIFQTLIGRSRSPNTATFPCPPEGIMDDTTATQCQVSKHLLRYCRISSCGSPAAAVTHLDRHSGPTPAAACLIRIKRSFRSCAGSHRPDGSSSSSSSSGYKHSGSSSSSSSSSAHGNSRGHAGGSWTRRRPPKNGGGGGGLLTTLFW